MKMFTGLATFALLSLGTVLSQAPVDLESELIQRGGFTQIVSLLKSAGLMDTLTNANELVLFAPTDDALARVPADQLVKITGDPAQLQKVLGYHAILQEIKDLHAGSVGKLQDKVVTSSNGLPIRINVYRAVHSVTAEGVNVTVGDIRVSNGYVHALDGIMIPPEGDIVDIATASGDFSSLLSLLGSVNLVDAIKSDMNITVFAPNDAAFAKVDSKVTAYLTSHPNDLKEVLLYHVVERLTLYSVGMRNGLTFHTADQRHDNLMVLEDFTTGDIKINTANIVQKDISATNGVLHVIDQVLIPTRVLLRIEESGITIG